MRARDLIEKLGREEDDFLRREFLAPLPRSGRIRVRLGGVACELSVKRRPRGLEEGWAIFRPLSHREAEALRPAPLADVRRYLALFPRARLVAASLLGRTWLGLPAAAPEKGVRVEGLAPIAFGAGLRQFETARVRFDGSLFLFEACERAAVAGWLRSQLEAGTEPAALRRSGLTEPERAAYELEWKVREEMKKPADERRLEKALSLADAELVSYEARAGQYTVRFRVDGETFESLISRDDLTVISAGVCLDGTDRQFDLSTLVGVLRERREKGYDD